MIAKYLFILICFLNQFLSGTACLVQYCSSCMGYVNWNGTNWIWIVYNADYGKCEQCLSTFSLDSSNSACVCPTHTFLDTNKCTSCDSTCQECIGSSTQCTSCNITSGNSTSNFYQNKCLAACPTGTYSDTSKLCQNCDSSCYTCNGGLATNCSACNTTGTSKYFIAGNNTCMSACPTGYYADTSFNCQNCDSSCYTCNGGSTTNCLTCNTAGRSQYFMNSNKTCMSSCPTTGYYADASLNCQLCDSTCYTCNGRSATNCLTCNTAGTGAYPYFIAGNNTCMSACPTTGYYLDSATNCQLCNLTCSTCNGGLGTNCLSCNTTGAGTGTYPYFMNSNKTCISACPTGYYADSSKNCQLCNSTCYTCNGGLATNC